MDPELHTQLVKSVELFKDWSDALLVTTVAALGWVTAKERLLLSRTFIRVSICCLCASIVFGIMTLALTPSVCANIKDVATPLYEVEGNLYLFWYHPTKVTLATVCWPQHVLFLAGVVCYVIAAFRDPFRSAMNNCWMTNKSLQPTATRCAFSFFYD